MIRLPDILMTRLNEETIEVTLLSEKADKLVTKEFSQEIRKDALLVSQETANKITEFGVLNGLKIDSELDIVI